MENSHHNFGARILSIFCRTGGLGEPRWRTVTITLVLDFVPFVSEKRFWL